jgi:four helix bundle protein
MALAHHTLIAWKRADDLFIKLHQLSLKAFPPFEKFELGGQLRRAAFSVAVNIVEGFARPAGRARVNFLNISQSSLAEVGYCIHVARRLGYLSEILAGELETEIKQVGAPLAGLIRSERLHFSATIAGAMFVLAYFTVKLA